ncbi:hypothetical protein LCGC14_0840090 [marine sediment metagenome]|uniref:Uncharacterized protein n=1 Tax=marine sediment metagenome TaxID=412755 RepID=A0A0F9RY40_9ZZZZ
MPRPPRPLSAQILATLDKRPKLRYTITSKGNKAFTRGDSPDDVLLSSLIEALDANNDQPVSLQTWREFHKPKGITNSPLRALVVGGFVSVVSRSKVAFAVR